jgi:hypothetical protein
MEIKLHSVARIPTSFIDLRLNTFFCGEGAPSGPGAPRFRGFTISLTYAPHSVGLLCKSDQPDAETST